MYILGLTPFGHDTSFAIASYKGEILYHFELERDVRIKQASSNSLFYALLAEEVYNVLDKITAIAFVACPKSLVLYSLIMKAASASKETQELLIHKIYTEFNLNCQICLSQPELIKKRLTQLINNCTNYKIFGHHRCHTAEAWGAYDHKRNLNNMIVTLDGGGWDFDNHKLKETHASITYSDSAGLGQTAYSWNTSLGLTYIETTKALGFTIGPPKGSQEGSVMGLAAYGEKNYSSNLFQNSYLWQNTSAENLERSKVLNARAVLIKDIQSFLGDDKSIERKGHIAAALQNAFEERFLDLIKSQLDKFAIKVDGYQNINGVLLSGGCALNCAAVGKLVALLHHQLQTSHIDVFVSPIPYDGGLAIGAIFCLLNESKTLSRANILSPYLGRPYTPVQLMNATRSFNLIEEKLNLQDVINDISNGKVLAVFQGKSESGRRALCNRSILGDPRNPSIRDLMNQKVKHRPLFRPFAPVILEDELENWFEYSQKSPFMSHALPFRPEKISLVPAVVHKDGTGRIQTVNSNSNPWMYLLLKYWLQTTGCPLLINTSFNDNEPIVETPFNAVACFMRTKIDYLLLPDLSLKISKTVDLSN